MVAISMQHSDPFHASDRSVFPDGPTETDDRYRLTPRRTLLHRSASLLPPRLREAFAEAWLRRADTPAPAAEHVFQYLRDAEARRTNGAMTTVKGADNFYRRQYRQYLNPVMGAFATTAAMAALAAGGMARGRLWSHRRNVALALTETRADAPPILVLDRETVAAALFLPRPRDEAEERALSEWLASRGPIPQSCRRSAEGEPTPCAEPGACATRRPAVGAMIEVAEAALSSGKLAILALHPFDPDAMGLHITLYGVEALQPSRVESDYGLGAGALDPWRRAAAETESIACFLVGGVEEAFTQCSQNLFVKRPCDDAASERSLGPRWTPLQPIDRLLGRQFEILQATVSASGLPGVSPRNGERGLAGLSVRRGEKTLTLIPYFAGNSVHGHAAKLWSNPWSSLLVWDDHDSLSAATISGPTRVIENADVAARFPHVAEALAARRRRDGTAADDPEYWFEQEVAEICLQNEPVAASRLDPARTPCSLNAGGLARHSKKPGYFDADSLPQYDTHRQHAREAEGRPVDPTGAARRGWDQEAAEALAARRAHLAGLRLDRVAAPPTDVDGIESGPLLATKDGV
jgi:hypothetical protein